MSQCLLCNKNKMENPEYFKFLHKNGVEEYTLSLALNRLKVKYANEHLCENCFVCSDNFRALMDNCNLSEQPSDVLSNCMDAANADSLNKYLSTYDSFTFDYNSDSMCVTDGKAKKILQDQFFSLRARKYRDRSIRLLPRKLVFYKDTSLIQTNEQQSWINKRKILSNEIERNFKRPKSEATDDGSSNFISTKSTGDEMEVIDDDKIKQQSATEHRNKISEIKLTPFRQFSYEKTMDIAEPDQKLPNSASLLKFQDEIRKTATDIKNVSKRFREETAMRTSTNKRTSRDF